MAEVYISHVTDTGDVFLQFESYTYVQSLVSSLIETCLKGGIVVGGSKSFYPDPSRLYLARYHQDGNWYRAAITKKLDGQNEVWYGIAANAFCTQPVFVFYSVCMDHSAVLLFPVLLKNSLNYIYCVVIINTVNLYCPNGTALSRYM